MNTKTFNENYELVRKKRGGIRANPKHTLVESIEIMTADGTAYDSTSTYYFFDIQSAEVRQSTGLRRDGEHLCTFGLKAVAVAELRACRDDALADGQSFFASEIERRQARIEQFETGKTNLSFN